MINLFKILFTPVKFKTAAEYKADYEACCARAYSGAVADLSRGNVNLSLGNFLTEQGLQKQYDAVLKKLEEK